MKNENELGRQPLRVESQHKPKKGFVQTGLGSLSLLYPYFLSLFKVGLPFVFVYCMLADGMFAERSLDVIMCSRCADAIDIV